MRVGLCFDGFYSIQEMIELSELADETGMDSIWMSDHLCFRDSLTTSMALLAKTQKIKVAPAPMSPYSRQPIISAMSIATMEEFAPGRVVATPGTGNAAALKEAGIESPRPLKTMCEYVEILRRLLSGGKVDQEGLAVAVGKRDWDAAKKYITDEVVRAHSVAGTPNECRQQLESFINGGLNLPVLLPMGTQEARKQVIRMAREVVG